jgi:hypothetical protein
MLGVAFLSSRLGECRSTRRRIPGARRVNELSWVRKRSKAEIDRGLPGFGSIAIAGG